MQTHAETPRTYAWRWCKWVSLCATAAALAPRASHLFEINTLAIWVLMLILWGGLAFVSGYVYGWFKQRRRVGE